MSCQIHRTCALLVWGEPPVPEAPQRPHSGLDRAPNLPKTAPNISLGAPRGPKTDQHGPEAAHEAPN
eukprot:8596631-Pyramimonas_sp.AAC.1